MDKPNKIYKYQPVSLYSLRNLKSNNIYFNHPNDFNDPYDTSQTIVLKNLDKESAKDIYFQRRRGRDVFERIESFTASLEEIETMVLQMSDDFEIFRSRFAKLLGIKQEEFAKVKLLNKAEEEFDENLLQESLVNLFYSSFNDTISKSLEEVRKDKVVSKGISCFSEVVDDLLMWSYYADGHRGFCLEFDTSYDPFTKLHKVSYVEESPIIESNKFFINNFDPLDAVQAFLATKHINWRHEKEWRVIHDDSRVEFTYKTNALTGVYFGSKIHFADLEIIALIVKGQNLNCNFYKMTKEAGKFKVIPSPIGYTSFQEAKNAVFERIKNKLMEGIFDFGILVQDINLDIGKDQLKRLVDAVIEDFNYSKMD